MRRHRRFSDHVRIAVPAHRRSEASKRTARDTCARLRFTYPSARDIGKKFGIVFDSIDIDKPACGLQVSLDAGEVEEAAKRRPIRPHLPLGRKLIEDSSRSTRRRRLVQLDVGIPQERGQIVGGRSHQGILKIDNAETRSIHHQIARMVIAMDERLAVAPPAARRCARIRPGSPRQSSGPSASPAGDDAILQEMVELPHEQRHIESPMKRQTTRIGRRGRLHLHLHQHVDRLPDSGLPEPGIGIPAGFRQREIAEIFQIEQPGRLIVVMESRHRHAGLGQMR